MPCKVLLLSLFFSTPGSTFLLPTTDWTIVPHDLQLRFKPKSFFKKKCRITIWKETQFLIRNVKNCIQKPKGEEFQISIVSKPTFLYVKLTLKINYLVQLFTLIKSYFRIYFIATSDTKYIWRTVECNHCFDHFSYERLSQWNFFKKPSFC